MDTVILVVQTYLGIGTVAAAAFLLGGVTRTVGAASIPFRIVVAPSCIVLWPIVVAKWLAAVKQRRGTP